MGGCCYTFNRNLHCKNINKVDSKKLFKFQNLLGIGTFGTVWQVTHRQTQQKFALKVMDKSYIIAQKCVKIVTKQLQIMKVLADLHEPFLICLQAAFQDYQKLFLLMELVKGKDLGYYVSQKYQFNEDQASIKFITINLIKVLKILRKQHIIHHDIKPQNIIIDQHGYARLSDYTLSQFYKKHNQNSNKGTLGYVPLEVLRYQNHDYSVDYFSLGATIYEIIFGKKLYPENDAQNIINMMQVQKLEERPQFNQISDQLKDFLIKILHKNNTKRLGYMDIDQIYKHKWINMTQQQFQNFTYGKQISPIEPLKLIESESNLDLPNLQQKLSAQKQYKEIKDRHYFQNIFDKYIYPAPRLDKQINSSARQQTRSRRDSFQGSKF